MAEGAALIELDHVLIAVSDLEAAAREVERRPALENVVVDEAVLDPALWA